MNFLVLASCITKTIELPTVLMYIVVLLLSETDVHAAIGDYAIEQLRIYLENVPKDVNNEIMNPPSNNNDSIQYLLFTPSNPKVACYVEPNPEDFDCCPFNSSYGTKFLLPGFNTTLEPGGIFMEIKDRLLDFDKYNVIIVNYTKYSFPPYTLAVLNVVPLGRRVADMVKFLIDYEGVNPKDVHLIGHSLGGQIVGPAGRNIPNLGRITALDPGGPLFRFNPVHLRPTDANFVDAMHTSLVFGIFRPLGDIDFYANGGVEQPGCEFGGTFLDQDRTPRKVDSLLNKILCNHFRSLYLFLYSIENCEYLATQCSSYKKYKQGKCSSNSHPTDRMGLHAKKIPGLRPRSMFYLETSSSAPFCETK